MPVSYSLVFHEPGTRRDPNTTGQNLRRRVQPARHAEARSHRRPKRFRTVREIVRRGLEEARGNYKIVARLFNMEPRDYKRFLNFLRKHDCQIPFKDYR